MSRAAPGRVYCIDRSVQIAARQSVGFSNSIQLSVGFEVMAALERWANQKLIAFLVRLNDYIFPVAPTKWI